MMFSIGQAHQLTPFLIILVVTASTYGRYTGECDRIEVINVVGGSVVADLLCGLVVRVLGYRSGGPDSIPGTTRKKK
jgi:hypothetical protein